jgi:hypothetical protein
LTNGTWKGYSNEAFVSFHHKEETKLAFIVQAPFLMTDSREKINAGEPWNVEIKPSFGKACS